MRKIRVWLALVLTALLCMAAVIAQADTFAFAEKNVTLFEGETWAAVLNREGAPAEEGELTFRIGNAKVAEVAEDGTVTALNKGQTQLSVTLKGDKRTWKASANITVLRRVTDVTLSTRGLSVYEPDDPAVAGLLKQDPAWPVIVLSAGKRANLSATCTPETASSRKVTFTSTDEGILKISEGTMRGVQAGECDLVIASKQNPEVTETYHVLVTQPITKIEITAAEKKVPAGETLALSASFEPANATMKQVEWSSRNPKVAAVDQNGVVTGIARGTAAIEAKALDGSGKSARFNVTVTQTAETLTLKQTEAQVVTGRRVTLNAQVGPNNTDDKTLTWSSSDESVATVSKGIVTGVKAGECEITCVSNSNPNLFAVCRVQVIQQVTKIEFDAAGGVSLPVKTTETLSWTVWPEDASIREVKLSSSNPKVAAVDQDGTVTGLAKGTSTITAAATDGSGRKGSVRVTVTQPVEGVSIQYGVYHIQLDRVLSVKALISPSNANNYNMEWYIGDESIASVKGNRNMGNVRGLSEGTTTVTGVTEDGGYSASAEIRVGDFNGAVSLEEVWVNNNRIRLTMRNVSDFVVERVYFRVECYDEEGNLIVSNLDGESLFFDGVYRGTLYPRERTEEDYFDFGDMGYEQKLGTVVVRITGWLDSEGYTRNIRETDDQPMLYWTSNLPFNPGRDADK